MIFFNKEKLLIKCIRVIYYIVYKRDPTPKEIEKYLKYIEEVENE